MRRKKALPRLPMIPYYRAGVWRLYGEHVFYSSRLTFHTDNLITAKLVCLSQGYQLHGTGYRGLVSSYKVEYSYDGKHWIAYVDTTKNSTSQRYRVSGFDSLNKPFVRPDQTLIDHYCYSWE